MHYRARKYTTDDMVNCNWAAILPLVGVDVRCKRAAKVSGLGQGWRSWGQRRYTTVAEISFPGPSSHLCAAPQARRTLPSWKFGCSSSLNQPQAVREVPYVPPAFCDALEPCLDASIPGATFPGGHPSKLSTPVVKLQQPIPLVWLDQGVRPW